MTSLIECGKGGENNMSDFFAKEESYDIPSTSNYMKFEDGDNQFRILGSFADGTVIQGIEYWKTVEGKRKPIRLAKQLDGTFPSVPMSELEINKYGDQDMPRYFWAMPVWNYQDKKVQILEITQKTILNYIKKMVSNSKWGDPINYDFIVTKAKGKNDKVEYTVTNNPKEAMPGEIMDTYKNTFINIKALFDGEDPFAIPGPDDTE